MNVLVVAQIDENKLAHSILNTTTAAKQLGNVDILVAGFNITKIAQAASKIEGVRKVLIADAVHYEHQLAENMAVLIKSIAGPYQYIIATSNTFGKNIIPRVAALLNISQVSDVTEIIDPQTFVHPVYAGRVLQKVCIRDDKVALTIRTTQFATGSLEGTASLIDIETTPTPLNLSRFIKRELSPSDHPDLTQARVIVAGGKGLGSQKNFNSVLMPLADTLNASIGASRMAVDLGYAPNDYQIGQTGKIVAPELYIAIGISGAIQHLAGIQDSKIIVAINNDPNAPIFNIADYGLVADLFDAVPELVRALQGYNIDS